jgi:hypothetical protein
MRVKPLASPVAVEPPRSGEDASDCVACNTPDDAYIWVSERWRVRAMDRPTGLPMVLILECRSHLDLGDLPNLLAAELGVMTVRLERAIRSLDGVARVHVNRWGDGSAHLHMWFLARPYGRLQLRGTFLSLWDDILPTIPEQQWRENLALVAAWLGEFGGRAIAEPPHIQWQSPSTLTVSPMASAPTEYESSSHGEGGAATGEGGTVTGEGGAATAGGTESVIEEPGRFGPPDGDVVRASGAEPEGSKPDSTEGAGPQAAEHPEGGSAGERNERPASDTAEQQPATAEGRAVVPRQGGESPRSSSVGV